MDDFVDTCRGGNDLFTHIENGVGKTKLRVASKIWQLIAIISLVFTALMNLCRIELRSAVVLVRCNPHASICEGHEHTGVNVA